MALEMEELARQSETPEIPDKLYFRIGEVSQLVGVKPYVLRYWQSEFPALAPKKSGTGHRLYRRKDVELLLEIKRLLYEKRFTIEGAKTQLGLSAKKERKAKRQVQQPGLFGPSPDVFDHVRRELADLLLLLK